MLRKRLMAVVLSAVMTAAIFTGCASKDDSSKSDNKSAKTEQQKSDAKEEKSKDSKSEAAKAPIEDGTYTAEFKTDSTMFHVNEANEGKGTLTVEDGKMTIHISLVSKNIVNLFPGTAKEAQQKGAKFLEPTTDKVTYSDGTTEEVYGFDVPVPALDEEFDLALIGTKGKWYDHKVSVKNPVKEEDAEVSDDAEKDTEKTEGKKIADLGVEDGSYTAEVTLTGGTGRATVDSPAAIEIKGDEATATIVWSSPYYDYMLVNDEKYLPVNKDGNSTFEIPIAEFDTEMEVTADTTAMSQPHAIDYTLNFDSSTLKEAEKKDAK